MYRNRLLIVYNSYHTFCLAVCGGVLSGSNQGNFSSPGYSRNYPDDHDCVWLVSVSLGNRIIFSFATFQLENRSNCYDYLEVDIKASVWENWA
ncbi:hypothetical protein DPMN_131710 [Dreissena polymorpha]|uniref:CUB domain-containing protein n=1 Tax=Dreissena polymorpha TaxID=45954 RepID=A0A9D4JBF5_DREPO|nr:hypothetical protein DPMN_131710 [Dreissena polymorpha]